MCIRKKIIKALIILFQKDSTTRNNEEVKIWNFNIIREFAINDLMAAEK